MRNFTSLLASTAVLAFAHTATAADTPNSMACGATVAWDATEESLKKQFGAENVVYKDLGGPEGTEMMGTAVNEKFPGKSFGVVWADEAKRANPSLIFVDQHWNEDYTQATPSDWVSGDGFKTGMTIEDAEKINGKPFKLTGFGWDYGGNVVSWEGGKMDSADPKCGIMVTFMSTAEDAPPEATGDIELLSNDPKVIASKPVIFRYIVSYVGETPQ